MPTSPSLRYRFHRSVQRWYHRLYPTTPLLCPKAVRTLDRLLQSNMHGLEIGAGRSTLWVAPRVETLESWEESAPRYNYLKQQREKTQTFNLTLRRAYSTHQCYQGLLEGIADGALDFALVNANGCRDFVSLHLLPKLRKGGFLMLTDAQWFLPSASRAPHARTLAKGPVNEQWRLFWKQVENWELRWISNGVTDTAFFSRPTEEGSTKSDSPSSARGLSA